MLNGVINEQLKIRNHYECEYSCPKSEGGCADDECTCGADSHNAEVETSYAEILKYSGDRLFE